LGWLGVDFFFMISGFVIFMTLHQCKSIWDFAIKRFARLYPTLVFACLASFVLVPLIGVRMQIIPVTTILPSLLLVAGYLHIPWVEGAYWSLEVEATFYVWIGILFFALNRRFLAGWVILVALSTMLPVVISSSKFGVLCAPYMPFFSFGIACYMRFSEERITSRSLLLLAVSAISYAISWWASPLGVHICVVAMVLLFEGFLQGWLGFLANPVLVFIGQISYPLYLLHDALGQAILTRFYLYGEMNAVVTILAVSLLMIAFAGATHWLIEIPAQRSTRALFRMFYAPKELAK
jgi:peptidoglycan/LPS O-acetylase OafA/YrhL